MTTTWCSMPMVECPHCEEEFQLDDYYDYETGQSFKCNKCEMEIHVVGKDTITELCLSTETD